LSKKPIEKNAMRIAAEEALANSYTPNQTLRPVEELLHELQVHQIELEMQNEALRETQHALEKSRDRYIDLYDFAPIGYLTLNHKGMITEANFTAASMLCVERKKLHNRRFAWFVSTDDGDKWHLHFQNVLRDNARKSCELMLRHDNGSSFNVRLDCMRRGTDDALFVRVALTNITERIKMEKQQRISAIAFETHEAILITDEDNNIIRVNQAFQKITGYSEEEVIGKNPRILTSGRQSKEFYAAMWKCLLESGTWEGEIWDTRKDGQVYPKWITITAVKDSADKTRSYVGIFSDISLRKKAEEDIYSLAFYDPLTKLPNRQNFLERIAQAQSISARSHLYGALIFLDIDRFKTLNDTLGHDQGDVFLVEVARRLRKCVREIDTVARLGGDEFVVLMEEIDADEEAASQRVALVAEKIRLAIAEPYLLKGHQLHSSCSLGVCICRGDDEPIEALLKQADMAMYQAKQSGRDSVRFFNPAMQLAVETRASLESDMRHAITEGQFQLYYQIQVNNEGRPIGAEALIRWMHPARGLVLPMEFIPIAEESSLILDIGHWVMETACKQLSAWSKREDTRYLQLAINVSAAQFQKHDFVNTVATMVHAHQIDPNLLKLELTEAVVLDDVSNVIAKMHALKALGIRMSLDDFGTGYSSLSYLKQLPLDQIKIDRSFVRDVTTDTSDAVMVQTIINLAQNFRMNVIAEGVETEAQLNFLKQNGCMAYQGYLFSKPVPIEAFETLLK
jgi:diguanylate cyclase (GGDEF)-like protein/PAS domain S-box-containing protein